AAGPSQIRNATTELVSEVVQAADYIGPMGHRRTRSARAVSFDRSTTCFSKGISSSYSPMSAFQQKDASGWKWSVIEMISFSKKNEAFYRVAAVAESATRPAVAAGAPRQAELD